MKIKQTEFELTLSYSELNIIEMLLQKSSGFQGAENYEKSFQNIKKLVHKVWESSIQQD